MGVYIVKNTCGNKNVSIRYVCCIKVVYLCDLNRFYYAGHAKGHP